MVSATKTKVALAGAGMVTRHHLWAWARLPRVEVAAICARYLENAALIALEAANGAFGTVSGNLSAPGAPPLPRDRLELIGERASIIFEDDTLHLTGARQASVRFDLEEAYQKSHDHAIAHFMDRLESGEPFETDRRYHLETLRLVEDAYRRAGHQRQDDSVTAF
ncbi:MAG: hypothetical protein JSW39_17385 [Desulfobacterales bacterium]|nr:MAG: hypothetical protein JSW39_17385 [Desulfobacterales bacterium]